MIGHTMTHIRLLVCIAGAALTSGCAIISSTPAQSDRVGIGYMLPKALVPVELVQTANALEVRILEAELVGDATNMLTLKRSGNIFTSDNIAITVDPKTSLLSAIDAKSEDKTLNAISALRAGLRAESTVPGEVVVYKEWIDLQDPAKASLDISAAIRNYLTDRQRKAKCGSKDAETDCQQLQATLTSITGGTLLVQVRPIGVMAGIAGQASAHVPPDCSAGLCYRINVPHQVTLTGLGLDRNAVMSLPTASATFVLPVERWAFVKTTHDIKLEGGILKSETVDRPSTALAIASAPLDIVKATLGAVSEVLQLRINISDKEKALAEAKAKEIKAQAALDQAQQDAAKSAGDKTAKDQAENVRLSGLGQDLVLRVRVGPGQSVLPTKVEPASAANPQPATATGPTSNSSSGSAGSLGK